MMRLIDGWHEVFNDLEDERDQTNIQSPCDFTDAERLDGHALEIIETDPNDGDVKVYCEELDDEIWLYPELLEEVL